MLARLAAAEDLRSHARGNRKGCTANLSQQKQPTGGRSEEIDQLTRPYKISIENVNAHKQATSQTIGWSLGPAETWSKTVLTDPSHTFLAAGRTRGGRWLFGGAQRSGTLPCAWESGARLTWNSSYIEESGRKDTVELLEGRSAERRMIASVKVSSNRLHDLTGQKNNLLQKNTVLRKSEPFYWIALAGSKVCRLLLTERQQSGDQIALMNDKMTGILPDLKG